MHTLSDEIITDKFYTDQIFHWQNYLHSLYPRAQNFLCTMVKIFSSRELARSVRLEIADSQVMDVIHQ